MSVYQEKSQSNIGLSDCFHDNDHSKLGIEKNINTNQYNFYNNYQKFLQLRKNLYPNFEFASSLWTVVMQIYDCELKDEVIYITNISQMAQIPQTTVLRHLDSLTKKDMVWRIRHFSDKRMVRVRLSPKFKKELDQLFFKISDGQLA